MSNRDKVEYVRKNAKKDPAGHHCHWPGCPKHVSAALFMCAKHWYMLPVELRNAVWNAYVPRQEITKTPSDEYMVVARRVMDWIKENHPDAESIGPELPRIATREPEPTPEPPRSPQGTFWDD